MACLILAGRTCSQRGHVRGVRGSSWVPHMLDMGEWYFEDGSSRYGQVKKVSRTLWKGLNKQNLAPIS